MKLVDNILLLLLTRPLLWKLERQELTLELLALGEPEPRWYETNTCLRFRVWTASRGT